jgi:hypothetical protein
MNEYKIYRIKEALKTFAAGAFTLTVIVLGFFLANYFGITTEEALSFVVIAVVVIGITFVLGLISRPVYKNIMLFTREVFKTIDR